MLSNKQLRQVILQASWPRPGFYVLTLISNSVINTNFSKGEGSFTILVLIIP